MSIQRPVLEVGQVTQFNTTDTTGYAVNREPISSAIDVVIETIQRNPIMNAHVQAVKSGLMVRFNEAIPA